MWRPSQSQMQRQDEQRDGAAQEAAHEQGTVDRRQKTVGCSRRMNHRIDTRGPQIPNFDYVFQRVTHSILPHESHENFAFAFLVAIVGCST